ncbi:hypothetical protein BD289DRAFT_461311 [Coniella lustricola]|uniref:Prolyl 4-hydroxylase alpha subunit domain-containing protein n=1 Tax=Coniella lustricola TaxID=2025994 RepID=A0A2T3A5Y3_9PEZI|nr:hypothetical protein BD289DRAFT_461311 [Coniella lustricola]
MSKEVHIPDDFLSSAAPPPADAKPITYEPIDWSQTCLPNNEGLYAVVLDNVLSPSECTTLLRLAESSVESVRLGKGAPLTKATWMPAMVQAGQGEEVLDSAYRNSDRIVWDCQEMVDRLLARCLQVTGYGRRAHRDAQDVTWEMAGLSKRMRFLRYGEGQFFAPHCDGNYSRTDDDGTVFRSFFTFHFYLNDSVAAAGEHAELVGGATTFFSGDAFRKVDIECKTGRVLIFQQRDLYHGGAEVVEGTKYSMRAELMYKMTKTAKK